MEGRCDELIMLAGMAQAVHQARLNSRGSAQVVTFFRSASLTGGCAHSIRCIRLLKGIKVLPPYSECLKLHSEKRVQFMMPRVHCH